MKEITVYRPNETFNAFRSYSVFVNGKIVFSLKKGEKKTLSVPEGANLNAKIDWCQSNAISTNESSNFIVQGNPILLSLIPITILLILIAFILKPEAINYILSLLGLIVLYFITFGRKAYLKIAGM